MTDEWLNEGHPAHVVAAWVWHSVKVQRDSYVQITDGHYDAFNNHPGQTPQSGTPGGTEHPRTAANARESSVPQSVPLLAKHKKARKALSFPGFLVAAEGFEPPTRGL